MSLAKENKKSRSTKPFHAFLGGLILFSGDGKNTLVESFKRLSEQIEIKKISSVYLVSTESSHISHIHEIISKETFTALSCVFKAETQGTALDVVEVFKNEEDEVYKREGFRSLKLNLLTFENETRMSPQLTLPFPELHQYPEILIPASEVWGEYLHPILNQNLLQLTQGFNRESWGSFYAQGKSIMDKIDR